MAFESALKLINGAMPTAPAPLALRLFGSMQIVRDGRAVPLPASRKTRAILGYLALSSRPVSRQRLCEMFFDLPDDPRAALRWSLSKLRPLLDDEDRTRLVSERDAVRIDLSGAHVDALAVQAQPDLRGETARDRATCCALLDLIDGELLEDCELPERPECSAWLAAQRQDCRMIALGLARELADSARGEERISLLRRLLVLDPADEVTVAALASALAQAGRRDEAEDVVVSAQRQRRALGLPDNAALRLSLAMPSPAITESDGPAIAQGLPLADTAIANSHPRPGANPLVGILPFADQSMEPLPGHVLDGFFEGLVHAMSRFRSIEVIAGASTTTLRGQIADPVEVARSLGADMLVVGSIARSPGGELRLRWRALHGLSGKPLALGDIEGALEDVWDLQETAASAIAVEVEPRAQAEAHRVRCERPTASPAAYDFYLQGLFAGFSLEGRDYAAALGFFQQAMALDPNFHPALAMAPWAAAYANAIAGPQDIQHYAEMSRTALRLGINDARTQATAGTALFYMAKDYAAARIAIDRAISLNPNEYTAWICGGWMHAMKGEAAEAHRMFDRSTRLNPLAYGANGLLSGRAMADFMIGEINSAEEHIRAALATDDGHPSALMTGIATAAALGLEAELSSRRVRFLAIYPKGLGDFIIQSLPFEDAACRTRYFDAVRSGGVPD